MDAKEKAKELVLKYYVQISGMDSWYILKHVPYPNSGDSHFENAKQCALIAVNEILNILFQHHEIDYWKKVKEEINQQ